MSRNAEKMKYRLTKDTEIFEGTMQEIESFLKHPNQVIYRIYNNGKTINGWKIEIEKRVYELVIHEETIDKDTSIIRLLRRNNIPCGSYKKFINQKNNGIEIKTKKILKEMGKEQ